MSRCERRASSLMIQFDNSFTIGDQTIYMKDFASIGRLTSLFVLDARSVDVFAYFARHPGPSRRQQPGHGIGGLPSWGGRHVLQDQLGVQVPGWSLFSLDWAPALECSSLGLNSGFPRRLVVRSFELRTDFIVFFLPKIGRSTPSVVILILFILHRVPTIIVTILLLLFQLLFLSLLQFDFEIAADEPSMLLAFRFILDFCHELLLILFIAVVGLHEFVYFEGALAFCLLQNCDFSWFWGVLDRLCLWLLLLLELVDVPFLWLSVFLNIGVICVGSFLEFGSLLALDFDCSILPHAHQLLNVGRRGFIQVGFCLLGGHPLRHPLAHGAWLGRIGGVRLVMARIAGILILPELLGKLGGGRWEWLGAGEVGEAFDAVVDALIFANLDDLHFSNNRIQCRQFNNIEI